MDGPHNIAAIDMGSNGIRIALGEADAEGNATEKLYHREPIRLGHDAFTRGVLSDATIRTTVEAFENFANMMAKLETDRLRAVSTSAMREVSNGEELAEAIEWRTGIRLEIIDPLEEARLMLEAVRNRFDISQKTAMLVDMGGGSVEVTMAVRGRAMGFESLPTGPVRLLEKLQRANLTETDTGQLIDSYQQMVQTLRRAELGEEPPQVAFGAGGNIKRLAKLRQALLGRTHDDRLKVSNLDALVEKLSAMDCDRRVKQLGLRPDRADLIVIAAIVLRSIMTEAGVEKIMVPGIGLLDGLLREVARGGGRAWGRLTQR